LSRGTCISVPLAHTLGRLASTSVSTIAYRRELVPYRPHQRIALSSLSRDRRVVTISEHSEALLERLGVEPNRRLWIAPELKPQFATVDSPKGRPPGTPLRLVTMTRLAEGYKNLEVLLRAARVLADAEVIDRLTIVGDGPRRAALKARVAQLELSDVVDPPGRLDDDELAAVLTKAHVGVFASRDAVAEGGFEGFGIVVQELAAAGLPVIVGDAAGAHNAAHSPWATLVDPDDTSAWVRAVEELVQSKAELHHEPPQSPTRRRYLGVNSLDTATPLTPPPSWRGSVDMCGIVATIGSEPARRAHRLLAPIDHRGPDGR
jgi:glycosyltransferase involved in cell wall biosynthesis